jgi:acyl carrier protein
MTRAEIEAVVFRALTTVAPEAEPSEVPRDADLRDELDLDSMDFTNFVIALHEQLGVDIPEVEYRRYYTLDGAVTDLEARLRARPTG